MQHDYDAEPDIPPFTSLEEGIQTFWEVSSAVKGVPGHTAYTVGRVFEILHPLKTQSKSAALKYQAEQLAELVVKNRIRRQTIRVANKVVQLFPLPKNLGQEIIQSKRAV